MRVAQRGGATQVSVVAAKVAALKTLSLIKEQFPGVRREVRALPYTVKVLIRAAVTAGQKMPKGILTVATRADTEMRINILRSAVDMSGGCLTPTAEFLAAGSTDKAHKSFYVGNTLCAHAAYAELRVPWLADLERLNSNCSVTMRSGCGQRPDYLGRDTQGRWYVFESKGRSRPPVKSSLKQWKAQAKAINKVNGAAVTCNIVSAAYVSKAGQWELLWVDPPPEPDDASIEFDEASFFDGYYAPVLALIEGDGDLQPGPTSPLTYVPALDAYIGLHTDVRNALRNRAASAIVEFGRRQATEGLVETETASDVTTFADGVIVMLGPNWNSARTETTPQDQQSARTKRMDDPLGNIGQPERATQNRVIRLLHHELGYEYLGDWSDRPNNSNIEESLLTAYLTRNGYIPAQISVAIYKLRTEATNHDRSLYGNNQAVYNLLRYGVPVKIEAGRVTETVHLINWNAPQENDFAVAEEVTLRGNLERRPDIVLYINGIAIGVLELKNSRVSIGDGIRQCLSNQLPAFNEWFFATVQLIMAGNDSEGLQYGTTGTQEKYFLKWKEDEQDDTRYKLDKYLLKLCNKDRLIELLHDFVLFDGGVKKVPRAHQYFGIKAAQHRVRERKGGIIWHTQGSGKSIVMVLLAKWILENNPHARVVIITDRDELDKQIERVFTEAGEAIKRTNSGRDLMAQLGQATPRLLCSLVHKFGVKDVTDFDAFIKELETQPSKTVGEVFVFVDECHRTQSGRLHRVMKAMMPNAVFIGFTGTPLLKKDKETSLEVFGGYIHTYKFSEGVEDGVVLDLVYEARDIDQRLGSEDKIDAWFEAKTKGLNDW
jgi:hypothetical protein